MPSVIKTPFKGVHWSANAKKWLGQIKYQHKTYHLGLYNDDRIAAIVYILVSAMLKHQTQCFDEKLGLAELKGNPPLWHIGQIGAIPKVLVDLAADKIKRTHNVILSRADEADLAKIFPASIPKTEVDQNLVQELYLKQSQRNADTPSLSSAASSRSTPITTSSRETEEEPMLFSSTRELDVPPLFELAGEIDRPKRAKRTAAETSLFELVDELKFEETEDEFKSSLGFIDNPLSPIRTYEFEGAVSNSTMSSSSAAPRVDKCVLKITSLDPTLYIATMQYNGVNYLLGFHNSPEIDDYYHNLANMMINRLNGNTSGLKEEDLNTVNFLITSASSGDELWNSTRDIALYLQSDLASQSDKAPVAQQAIEIFKHNKQAGHHRHLAS